MVLVKAKAEVTRFECFVAIFFELGGDLEDLGSLELLALILGEILIGVAGAVGLFVAFANVLGFIAGELSAVFGPLMVWS